ncbi:hypothetical protein QE152_g41392, partial [Popillia japonica]
KKFNCYRCKTRHGLRECPAYGKKCTKCGILNHFARACRIKNVEEVQEDNTDTDNESENDEMSIYSLVIVNSLNVSISAWYENIRLDNKAIKVKDRYRNTPITELGLSPAQVLMSRSLRTKIPVCDRKLKPKKNNNQIRQKIQEERKREKDYYDRNAFLSFQNIQR